MLICVCVARFLARLCMESCEVNGLHIPAGVTVQADVWTIHNDPVHWGPDPDRFDPERQLSFLIPLFNQVY